MAPGQVDLTAEPAFATAVASFVDEAASHGWDVSPGAAAALLATRVADVAANAGVDPAVLCRQHLSVDAARTLARDAVPGVARYGGTGMVESDVRISVGLAGDILADLGSAARFAATHRDRMPHADLHNVVADAIIGIGSGLVATDGTTIVVDARTLRLAARALELVAARIAGDRWVLEGLDDAGEMTLVELTERIGVHMTDVCLRIWEHLSELPGPQR